MSDCVLDASAMVLALSGKTDAASALRTRLVGVRRHAPHLIDAEVTRDGKSGLVRAPSASSVTLATRAP